MVHGIEVHLGANIEKYKAGMEAAKRTGTESLGFIATIFDKIKSLFSGIWNSISSVFSGIWDKLKGGFSSMSDSLGGAFQKIAGYFPSMHKDLDKTNAKMGETEEKSASLVQKIGITLTAAFVALTAVVGVMVKKGLDVDATFAGLATSSDIAVSQISKFDAVAARSGVGVKDLGASMVKFREEMNKSAAGDGSSVFDKLGVKVADSNNALLRTDTVLVDVAKKISGMSSEAEKYAAAAKVGFDGKVQALEDIAHASDLVARVTDEQAGAAVRLGKIWHEILPSGRSMWAEISDKLTNSLTPAMNDASVSILESKNRIVEAFSQIYGGGSLLDKLGSKIRDWSKDASKWFGSVETTATNMTISVMKFIAAKTGLGNADAFKPTGAGYVPGPVQIVSGKNDPVAKAAEAEALKQYEATTKAINEKIAAQKLEGQTGEALTEGQRMAIQMMVGLRDGTLQLTDAQKTERTSQLATLIEQEKANKQMQEAKAKSAAAGKKEEEAYHTLIAAIVTKTNQNKLEAEVGQNATEGQKLQIRFEQELAAGKITTASASYAVVKARLAEMAVSEDVLKQQQAQKDVTAYIAASTVARDKESAALEIQYRMFGKSADARAMEMVVIEAQQAKEVELAALRKGNLPISEQIINQLNAEERARILVGQATIGQGKALEYASQLMEENKRFGLEYIADDKQRAAATLALDAQVWQERIRLAGEGTEAQKILQQNFDTWYANQSIKPALDEQKQMWGAFQQTAHDTFISIEDGTRSFVARLRNTFKNGFFEWLWQMTAKPWVVNLQASMSTSAATGATSAVGGAATGAVGLAQGASNLYSMVTGGMTLSGGLGSGFMGSLAGGLNGAGVGAGLTSSIGLSIGNSIADVVGPSIAGALSTGMGAIATALPWVGAAVAAISIGKMAFGMGSKETTATGISGTLSDGGVTGQSYTDWKKKGGWFRSDQHGTDTSALSGDLVKQFSQGLSSLESAADGFASSLGLSADAIKGYSKDFNIALTGDAAKDQQAITDFFAGVGNELATKLVPNLDQFTKSGETASAALQRLSGDFAATNQVAQLIGKSGVDVFGSLGMDSAAARERLIDLSGGVSVLSQQAQAYAQNFLTDAQRLAPVQTALDAAMASLGLSSVQTREQFKAVVDCLDLTTEAGAQEFASLMKLADAFAQVHAAGRSAADILSERKGLQDQLDELTMSSVQLLAKQRDALDVSNVALFDQVQALKDQAAAAQLASDALDLQAQIYQVTGDKAGAAAVLLQQHQLALAKTDPALRDLTQQLWDAQAAAQASADATQAQTAADQARATALQAVKDAGTAALANVDNMFSVLQRVAKGTTDTLTARINAEKSLSDAARSTLASMKVASMDLMDRAAAQAQIKAALAISKAGGPLPTADSLKDALSVLSQDASAKFASEPEYLKDLYSTKIDLSQLGDLADSSLSVDQQQLDSLNAMLAADQQQIDLLKGIASALTIQQAQGGFQQAVAGAQANPYSGSVAGITSAYASVLGRAPDAEGLEYWKTQAAGGMSIDQITAFMKDSSEYKSLHPFAVGTNFVPETMPALVHPGERIIPAADNRELMRRLSSPSENNAALLAELKALRQEVATLRQNNSAENVAQVKQLQATVDLLTRVIYGGETVKTEAATSQAS